MKELSENDRRILLNQETGIVTWPDVQRHFARGVLVYVEVSLDLVTVADAFVVDNKSTIETWYQSNLITRIPDDIAQRWAAEDISLWAIVIAPWVLVQEPKKDIHK